MLFFFFFFSSRRRHTRCYRDWSSDVCSSDLEALGGLAIPVARQEVLAFARPLTRRGGSDEQAGERGGGLGSEPGGEARCRPQRRGSGRLVHGEVAAGSSDSHVEVMERAAGRRVLTQA